MSRIGLKPVKIPSGVEVTSSGQTVTVKGPKGGLSIVLPSAVAMDHQGEEIRLTVSHPEIKKERALWGTFRAHLQNMVRGVTSGFSRSLEINGIGYRVSVVGKKLVLEIGFSHEVNFPLPEGVTAVVDKNTVTLSGADKQLVGETAARLRRLRPPEPYKGSGIKYTDEIVRRKAGKAGKAGAAAA
jgi:large subunit ribosomal protein L6